MNHCLAGAIGGHVGNGKPRSMPRQENVVVVVFLTCWCSVENDRGRVLGMNRKGIPEGNQLGWFVFLGHSYPGLSHRQVVVSPGAGP